MPGKRVTDHQVIKYKQLRQRLGQEAAAAKIGISERTARRLERLDGLPSQRAPRTWRTRIDPLATVWASEVVPMLRAAPGLTAVTVLEELQRRYSGEYPHAVLRTLQRRLRRWRAFEGPEREVYFAQQHEPGRLGLSDFTHATEIGVYIAGAPFEHLLYQFALAYSGWRHVAVVLGGECFLDLSAGLQDALWELGGSPHEHRTDSLSAAFRNLAEREDLTRRYEWLCAHYGMVPSRNNRGASHENGSIEARQGTLKHFVDQALLLRGHREFDTLEAYRHFLAEVTARANGRIVKALAVERACLRPLPPRRTNEYEEVDARATKFAIFTVRAVPYSVPSRLVRRQGIKLSYGTIVDATIISAPSSTKNGDGKRDPEMGHTAKGKVWHFGMKAHVGVDSRHKLIHTVQVSPANWADSEALPHLLRGTETKVWGDQAYHGQGDMIRAVAPNAQDCTNRRSRYRGGDRIDHPTRAKNRNKSRVRAKVEHVFGVIKNIFGFRKVRYRGLEKNRHRLEVTAALTNLYLMRRTLIRLQG